MDVKIHIMACMIALKTELCYNFYNKMKNKYFRVQDMTDYLRENLSYGEIYYRLFRAKKHIKPEKVSYGNEKEQYFLYYRPVKAISRKVIIWVHGGGWNAGSPRFFDYVGQRIAGAGYHFVSVGYRHSPKHKYPAQIEDVCRGFNKAVNFLKDRGNDTTRIILSGPSAGAHLSSILCYSKKIQAEYSVDISGVIGFIGMGGPYRFSEKDGISVKLLLNQLFGKGYDRRKGEPCFLMEKSDIPRLVIQSRHDGLIDFECRQQFCEKASALGNRRELYRVEDKKNTHSWYTAGCFLLTREGNKTLDKFFTWVEEL